jgi:hypothetical protein
MLDYHEEMGIMIQEVVGKKVGNYFFPAIAGVAFSQNEFRWSSRIRREDGLVRIVPGLGTRAVDRLSDDYPVLISPGQPRLRVNVTVDEIERYSPKNIDVINLNTGSFETIEIKSLLGENWKNYPMINQVISVIKDDHIQQPRILGTDFEMSRMVITFEGLVSRTPFIDTIRKILKSLHTSYNHPVDIEFAHDGDNFFLLQCRSQSSREESKPVSIPKNIPEEKIIFTAKRYISNAVVKEVSHIVYVDPQLYGELSNYQDLVSIGRIIGKLNKQLPKRCFILIGPGRWGSRGDIKLGVNVTYSEINNTAVLIEVARKQKDYVPDLSFGTHFFQDLVESNIKYLPLYPDDEGIIFNESFLNNSENQLNNILADPVPMDHVVRVIDIEKETNGGKLTLLMSAENDRAVAFLSDSQ